MRTLIGLSDRLSTIDKHPQPACLKPALRIIESLYRLLIDESSLFSLSDCVFGSKAGRARYSRAAAYCSAASRAALRRVGGACRAPPGSLYCNSVFIELSIHGMTCFHNNKLFIHPSVKAHQSGCDS